VNRFIGTAGWSLRTEWTKYFPTTGTHLERYATRFNAVEINSSFYRSHRQSTYARWADSVPANFRFAVKIPKQITHLRRLLDSESELERFTTEISGLGEKLGAVLVQLPPSLIFEEAVAKQFFDSLRTRLTASIVCEPRHPTWFTPQVESLFAELRIGRVAADPCVVSAAAEPGGYRATEYFRWHGSPRMYYSSYEDIVLQGLARQISGAGSNVKDVWCIFDNTAEGAASKNALRLQELLGSG
jgi:uncharacterized protein YecE (DUF72 family)